MKSGASRLYAVHGVVIASDFSIDILDSSSVARKRYPRPTVDIELLNCEGTPRPAAPPFRHAPGTTQHRDTDGGVWLKGPCGSVGFIPYNHNSVVIERNPLVDPHAFQHTITSFFLPAALALSGHVMLHCACISLEGVNVLLGGSSFAGKSTASAGLRARGHHVLSDDTTRITSVDSRFLAHPSYPLIRLREPSASLPEIIVALPKSEIKAGRYQWFAPASDGDAPRSLPINGFLHLSRAHTKARLTPLSNAEKIQRLISSVFLTGVSTNAMIRNQFSAIIDAAPHLSAATLAFRHSPREFPQVLDAIESFASSLQQTQGSVAQ
jgi:hypothetical protein